MIVSYHDKSWVLLMRSITGRAVGKPYPNGGVDEIIPNTWVRRFSVICINNQGTNLTLGKEYLPTDTTAHVYTIHGVKYQRSRFLVSEMPTAVHDQTFDQYLIAIGLAQPVEPEPEPVPVTHKKILLLNEKAKPKETGEEIDWYRTLLYKYIVENTHATLGQKQEALMHMKNNWFLSHSLRNSMRHAHNIDSAFTWSETPQGQGYWSHMHDIFCGY